MHVSHEADEVYNESKVLGWIRGFACSLAASSSSALLLSTASSTMPFFLADALYQSEGACFLLLNNQHLCLQILL